MSSLVLYMFMLLYSVTSVIVASTALWFIKYYLPEVSLGFHIEKNTLYVYSFDPLTFTPLKYSEDNYMSQKSFDKIVEIYEDQEYLKSFNINSVLKEVRTWEKCTFNKSAAKH